MLQKYIFSSDVMGFRIFARQFLRMKPLTFTLLLFALLLCVACGQSAAKELNGTGSPVPDTSAIITAVERNLATMDEMPPDNIEDDNRYDLAVDLLDTLVDLVNIHHVNLNRFETLDHTETPDHKLSFCSFYLNCFCTAPPAYSLIVWDTPFGEKAQKWGWQERMLSIHEIDTANGLYLLLLSEKLSGAEYQNTAQVIQITGDTLHTNYPAFADGPRFSVHNGVFSYDSQSKTLSCKSVDIEKDFSFSLKFDGSQFQSGN